MKKIYYIFCVAVLGLAVSCAKNEVPGDEFSDRINVEITPNFTKTEFFHSGHTAWTNDDQLSVGYASASGSAWSDSGNQFNITLSGENAVFGGSIKAPKTAGSYQLYAIHPYKADIVWTSKTSVKTSISASQTAKNGGFDASSDILISKAENVELSPSTSSLSNVQMSFARVNSIARICIGTFARSDINPSDQVSSVKFSTDANVNLAGEFTVDFTDYTKVACANGSKELTLSLSKATLNNLDANFNVAPVTLPAGSKLTIELATMDYKITKTVTLTSAISFKQNEILQFACKLDDSWKKDGESSQFEGSGTQADPYLIKTYKDMVRLSNFTNGVDYAKYTDKYYKLTADIDMSPVKNFSPCCATAGSNTFKGVLDGNGHNIYNLTINGSGVRTGIFAYIGYKDVTSGTTITTPGASGTVKDLKIGTKDGSSYDGVSKVTFSNETSTDLHFISVLCGAAYNANVSNVVNYVPIEAKNSPNARLTIGTLAGCLLYRTVYENCVNYGDVVDSNQETAFHENLVGGTFGTVYTCVVAPGVQMKNCVNRGNVTVSSPSATCIAGILANIKGDQFGVLTSCKNYGNIRAVAEKYLTTTGARVGGIAGYLNGMAGCKVIDCENHADLKDCGFIGLNLLGGIAGASNKNTQVTGCKNYGDLEVTTSNASFRLQIGGILAQASAKTVIDNCVNEGNIKGCRNQVNCLGGVIGILNASTLTNSTNKGTVTHDMTGITGNANWQSVGGVIGFVDGSSACTVTGNVNEASGVVKGIVTSTYTDVIAYGGLTGIIKPSGTYSNNTNKADISADNTAGGVVFVGGIVGEDYNVAVTAATGNVNYGNVSATGTVAATTAAGGIIGNNVISAAATGNKSFGAITSNGCIGAVAGINAGTVSNSTVSGSVGGVALTAENYNNYLCSMNSGTISATYGTN